MDEGSGRRLWTVQLECALSEQIFPGQMHWQYGTGKSIRCYVCSSCDRVLLPFDSCAKLSEKKKDVSS